MVPLPYRLPVVGLIIVMASCAGGEPGPPPIHSTSDWGFRVADFRIRDILPSSDVYSRPRDQTTVPFEDGGCEKGTVDNCKQCGDTCPPGEDTSTTARICASGECDIQCKEEYYDVNVDPKDGCEAVDDLPIHDSQTEAAPFDKPDVTDCNGDSQSTTAMIPSDDRQHLKAPTSRTNGRADWFKLHINDNPGCIVDGKVHISLASLPSTGFYRVAAFYICDGGTELTADSQTGYGGTNLYLSPSVNCTGGGMGDDSGTLYIKVLKESGAHSNNSYTVNVTP